MGRLLTRTDASNETETFTYDETGNRATYTDKRGQVTRLSYDEANRLTEIEYVGGTSQTRSYDIASRLTEIREGNSLIRLEYDDANRLTKEITDSAAGHNEVSFTFDGLDRRTRRTLTVNGRNIDQTDYSYDTAGRLATITYTAPGLGLFTPEVTNYAYDIAGRLSEKTLPNGIRQVLAYDEANRLIGVEYRGTGNSLVQGLGYNYDGNGNVTERTRTAATSLPDTPISAEYDAANRMTRITINPSTPDARTYALSYDDQGNLVRKENVADPADVTTYNWDSRNRLTDLTAPGITGSFAYDAIGRRVAKIVNGQTVGYVYDGIQAIGEVANGQATGTLLTGTQIDETVARFTESGQRLFLIDTLGSVLAQTAENQIVAATYVYSPYGEVLAQGDQLGNSTQYTGRENDGTELYFYRARYYDPQIKRFIASDPIGLLGGANTYAYVGGNPLSYIDPYGLWAWGDPLPQGLVDFSAGFGDTISFGATDWVRDQMGTNDAVDKCSGGYSAGEWAGVAYGFAAGGAAGWRSAGKKAGTEFSHWIPNRMGGPRSLWNGNFVTSARHYFHDPYRYLKGWRGAKWPAALQQLDRIPNVYKGAATGGGAAGASAAGNGCGCQ